jgi:hypothetical protein
MKIKKTNKRPETVWGKQKNFHNRNLKKLEVPEQINV